MTDIKNAILQLLEQEPETRKDDFYLWGRLLEKYAITDDTEAMQLFCDMLKQHKQYDLVNFKTVERSRALIQSKRPDLTDSETQRARRRAEPVWREEYKNN